MLVEKKNTLHSETLSLLPLKATLLNAVKDSPPCAMKQHMDVNEELASKLIEKMRKDYRKSLSFADWKVESPHGLCERTQELA